MLRAVKTFSNPIRLPPLRKLRQSTFLLLVNKAVAGRAISLSSFRNTHPKTTRLTGRIDTFILYRSRRSLPTRCPITVITMLKSKARSTRCIEHKEAIRRTKSFLLVEANSYLTRIALDMTSTRPSKSWMKTNPKT